MAQPSMKEWMEDSILDSTKGIAALALQTRYPFFYHGYHPVLPLNTEPWQQGCKGAHLADARPSPRCCVGAVRPLDSHHWRREAARSPSGSTVTTLRVTVDSDTPAKPILPVNYTTVVCLID